MDLPEQFAAIWARRLRILAVAGLVAVVVFLLRSIATPSYAATTTVQTRIAGSETSDPTAVADYYAQTVVGLATSRGVVTSALQASGSSENADAVIPDLTVELGAEPGFVEITAAGADPDEAARLANGIVAALQERLDEDAARELAVTTEAARATRDDVERRLRELGPDDPRRSALERQQAALTDSLISMRNRPTTQLNVVDPARPPERPSAPRPARDALLAFILALIIAAEVVVVARAWRGSLSERHPDADVSRITGAPTVEVDERQRGSSFPAVLPWIRPERVVTVVQRGKDPSAYAAARLAGLLAGTGAEVVLVDVAVGGPVLHSELGLYLRPGLTDVLAGRVTVAGALVHVPSLGLRVLPAGAPGGSTAAYEPGRLSTLIGEMPAARVVLCATNTRLDRLVRVVAECGDAVVLDVDARTVTRRELGSDVEVLRGLGARIVAATVYRSTPSRLRWLRSRDRQPARGVMRASAVE